MDDTFENQNFPFPVKRVHPDHPSVTERYFSVKFSIPKPNQMSHEFPVSDQCIMFHSNRIVLITLSPNHPVVKDQKEVNKVEFVQQNIDNSVSGKRSKGGQRLKPCTVLCRIHCKDETIYTVNSGIKASLIEINKKLIDKPQLVVSHTWSKGYIAIVQQTFEKDNDKILLDYDQYIEQTKKQPNLS